MADLAALLQASLSPATRKDAELTLESFSLQPYFLLHLLNLVLDQSKPSPVRLAGSVYLKNIAKSRWVEVRALLLLSPRTSPNQYPRRNNRC